MDRRPAQSRAGSVYVNSGGGHGWLLTLLLVACALLAAFLGLRAAVDTIASEPAVHVRVIAPLGGPAGSRALARDVAAVELSAQSLTEGQSAANPVETPAPETPTPDPTESPRDSGVSAAGSGSGAEAVTPIAPTPTTSAPVTSSATSSSELRIWAGGDSLSQFMGESIYRRANGVAESPATFIGSGLVNTSIVDWPSYATSEMALYDPDVAVFVMGTNDAKAGLDLDDYARRAGAMMDLLGNNGARRVVWVGAPTVSSANAALNAAIPGVNAAVASEAAARPWVTYISAWDLLSDGGAYAEWLPGPGGSMVRVRAGDGIHYTTAGGELVASAVLAAIR